MPTEDAFYISATQSAAGPRRTLKHNDTFVVLDSHGDIGATPEVPTGCFTTTPASSRASQLLVNDTPPLLLGSNLRDDNAALVVDLTNPDVISGQHIVLEKDTVHILRTIFLWRDTAYQRLGVRNYGDRTIDVRLSILFAQRLCRSVRSARHPPRAARHRDDTVRGDDQVLLNYHGLDGKLRRTTLTFDPPPGRLTTERRRLRTAPRAGREPADFPRRRLRRGRSAPDAVPARAAPGAPRDAERDAGAHQRRNVERTVQRDALPLGGRS